MDGHAGHDFIAERPHPRCYCVKCEDERAGHAAGIAHAVKRLVELASQWLSESSTEKHRRADALLEAAEILEREARGDG